MRSPLPQTRTHSLVPHSSPGDTIALSVHILGATRTNTYAWVPLQLVEKFLHETEHELGWLDIKSHPLSVNVEQTPAIRVTMYNPQSVETVQAVQDFMSEFQKRHE
jgi:phosphoserine aminotransferase